MYMYTHIYIYMYCTNIYVFYTMDTTYRYITHLHLHYDTSHLSLFLTPKLQGTVEESQGHMQSIVGPGHAQDFGVHLPNFGVHLQNPCTQTILHSLKLTLQVKAAPENGPKLAPKRKLDCFPFTSIFRCELAVKVSGRVLN